MKGKILFLITIWSLDIPLSTLCCESTSFCLAENYDKETIPSQDETLRLGTKIEILDVRVRNVFLDDKNLQ